MRVLVVGGGAREHALCWAISQSPQCGKLFCAPGNAGIAAVAECVPLAVDAIDTIAAFVREKKIDLVVVGPELPLILGLADQLRKMGVACFGPSADAAELEGSKGYVKDLCQEYGIPTARYQRVSDQTAAEKFLQTLSPPYVLKADGLAAGKGVIITPTLAEAQTAAAQLLAAYKSLVIEEFLAGEEISFFALVDGDTVVPLMAAQDHKRAFEGDEGPNTGGMGAYSPPPAWTAALENETLQKIIIPTARAMVQRGRPFSGVLFAGLMLTRDGPKLLEYNVRFGDPECQAIIPRLDGDWLALLHGVASGKLAELPRQRAKDVTTLGVVMAAKGYPDAYQKNTPIKGVTDAAASPGALVFHAATAKDGDHFTAQGGRVLSVVGLGIDVLAAQKNAYAAVHKIDWPDGFYRRDIGWRALRRPSAA